MSVPTHWRLARFDEVFDSLQYGLTASADRTSGEEGPRFLRITDIQSHDVDWSSVPTCEADQDAIARYKLANDDIVFARTGSIEKTWRVRNCPRDAVFASYLIRGKLRERRIAPWVGYFLRSQAYLSQVFAAAAGIGRANVNATSISGFTLPVAPLHEQQRIVAAIETHFTRLDAAVESLKRAKANVKRARASVLKAAVEGRLVPTEAALARAEGRTFEPASALLAKILDERKAAWLKSGARGKYKEPVPPDTTNLPKLPEGWCWTTVDATTLVTGGITKNVGKRLQGRNIPYLRVANVYADELRLEDVSTIPVADSELDRVVLEPNDLLVVEGNGSADQLGRVALWNGSIHPCAHQNHLIRARPMASMVPRWLLFCLLSPQGRTTIRDIASSTSGLHTLSLSKVQSIHVPLPAASEQARIVAEVDRRLSVLAALDVTLDANLARCTRLRQSVLKRAFEGRLVDAEALQEATPPAVADQLPLFAKKARR